MGYSQICHQTTKRVGENRRAIGLSGWQKHRELFAAIAGDNVTGAIDFTVKSLSNRPEAVIASLMSIHVIEEFEVIDIEEKERKW